MQRSTLLVGIGLGAVAAGAVSHLTSHDLRPMSSPLDQQRLVIRHDAKGDGHFGAPRSGNRVHQGVDLVAPIDTPVRAIRSGRVIEAGAHRGRGRFIELEHPRRLRSVYAHLQDIRVSVDDRVRQGDVIGTVGKTGNARHPWITPHLHLEIFRAGEPIDPATLGLTLVDGVDQTDAAHAVGGE